MIVITNAKKDSVTSIVFLFSFHSKEAKELINIKLRIVS